MSTECPDEHELPKDAIQEISRELLGKCDSTLEENAGFKKALTEKFLESPNGEGWMTPNETRIEFESKESVYELIVSNRLGGKQLVLSTENENVTEYVYVSLFNVKREGKDIPEGRIVFMRTRPTDEDPVEQSINSSEAVAKVRAFLHQI